MSSHRHSTSALAGCIAAVALVGIGLPAATGQDAFCTTQWPQQQAITYQDLSGYNQGFVDSINKVTTMGIMNPKGGAQLFSPGDTVTREEMAFILINGKYHLKNNQNAGIPAYRKHSAVTSFPPANGTFSDVPLNHPLACWIEKLAFDGITYGCGAGRYCPKNNVTRAEMSVFLIVARDGAGPTNWTCPTVTYADVPCTHWAAKFIYTLCRYGITSGCGSGYFCPDNTVTRAEMAVFSRTTFVDQPSQSKCP